MILWATIFGLFQMAHADLSNLAGTYSLSPQIEVASGWTEVQIPLNSTESESEFKRYQSRGWQCRRVSSWGICKGWTFEPLRPDEASQVLTDVHRRGPLRISTPRAAPELIHKSEIFKQYRLFHTAKWADQEWSNIDAFDFGDRLVVNLRDSSNAIEQNFQVGPSGQLTYLSRYLRRIDARKTQVLWLEISLWPKSQH